MLKRPTLKKLGQKAVDTGMRVAKEVKRAAENTATNANKTLLNAELHKPRIESNDIINDIIDNYDKIDHALTKAQGSIAALQVTLEALERDAKDLKDNKEILEQLRVIREGTAAPGNSFADARGAMMAIQLIQKRIMELNVVVNAHKERDAISNAPKETDYSRTDAKAIAEAAKERMQEYQTTIREAAKSALDVDLHLHNNLKPALEVSLQNARLTLTANLERQALQLNLGNQQVAAQAPAVAPSSLPAVGGEASSVDRNTFESMRSQLANAQAELSSLRAAAGLNNSLSGASDTGTVSLNTGTVSLNNSAMLNLAYQNVVPSTTVTVHSGAVLNDNSSDKKDNSNKVTAH